MGKAGDFFTSAHLGPDFGELLAVQLEDLWQHLGQPHPFTVLEMGAGDGRMAADIVAFLEQAFPACFAALHYGIVERSPQLQQRQQQTLAPWLTSPSPKVRWYRWEEVPRLGMVGCCLSNELVDALPVHRVQVQDGRLQEVYVTWDGAGNQAIEVLGELSTPDLAMYFADFGLDLTQPPYPEGYCTEVNLAAKQWLATLAQGLDQGYILTIDYGYGADRYYQPSRNQGTLQAYRQHRRHNDPYAAPGHQDLTAHVNFTALEQWGEALGLANLGRIPQGFFLMALGLGDRLGALSNPATAPSDFAQLLQRRDALHQLIDMSSSGLGKFEVLVQAKGLTADPPAGTHLRSIPTPDRVLKGLNLPSGVAL
ncbi:MAG: class I SAM-dependent methyltransferase [Prochlorothrix sp.]